jgi:acyl transferase domain-containing protein/NADPH:quinone reductase-like Zn-dependent oxidoreductase/acyl carrier protein/SAM-dependent methyltransferase
VLSRRQSQVEIEAILKDVAARRLSEEEAYARIRALSATREGSQTSPVPPAVRVGPGDASESPTPGLSVQVEGYLRVRIGEAVNLAPDGVSVDQPFLDLGFDSASLIAVVERMEREVGTELSPTLFFQHQTIRELGAHLAADHGARFAAYFGTQAAPAPSVPAAPGSGSEVAAAVPQDASLGTGETGGGDIAVIGMSGRFAGSRNLSEFWGHLRDSADLVGDIPADHWDWRPWFDARPDELQKTYCRWGSFLSDIDKFDPLFFHMSPREADITDPQLRHLLEVLYETTEDAGYASRIWGTRTGMFVGVCFKDYWDEIVRRRIPVGAMEFPGCAMSFMANRPSYFFDLRGPSVPVDDACSSSLVALHLACKALQRGECEMAFASGINVLLSPLHYVYFSALGALSPTGRCRSFTDRADGYVPGEGIVSVLLKPLDRAIGDGDNIHAVIKGSAVNHGGRANNPTSPRTQLQTEVLCSAWRDARIDPGTLDYIEAHGTGTLLGDPIEVDALKQAFRNYTANEAFCALGSAKANIGHTEAAAGLAGFVKVILSMKHGTIPAMPGFNEPNPYLKLEGSPLYINTRNLPWPAPAGRPRRAGVSSFGIGGANAHVVVEDYADTRPSEPAGGSYLFVLSAHTEARLKAGADRFRRFLEGAGASCAPQDLCHTLQVGRQAMDQRLAVVFRDPRELVEALGGYAVGGKPKGLVFTGRRKPNGDHPAETTLRSWWSGRELGRLGEAWAGGADVPWGEFPAHGPARRVSLPFYAFEQRRHWLPETGREGPDWGASDRLHALLDRVVPSFEGPEFVKAFRGDEPFLRDHRVNGEQLLPGVVHLEMALAAAGALGRGPVLGLSDVTWMRPVVIDGSGKECRIRLRDEGGVTWSLESPGGSHTEGRVDFAADGVADVQPRIDLDAVRARCVRPVSSGEVYGRFAATGIAYGETLRPVTEVWTGPGEALARLECAAGGAALSSTVLLDGLLQASIALYPDPQAPGEASLPYAADSVRVFRAPSGTCHAYVRALVEPARGGDPVFDMVLTDETGAALAQISGIRMRAAGGNRSRAPEIDRAPATVARPGAEVALKSYVPRWRPAAAAAPWEESGSTLIFRHARDLGLAERLAARNGGRATTIVHLGRRYHRINERLMAIDCRSAEDFARVIAEHPNLGTVYFLGGLPSGLAGGIALPEVGQIKAVGVLSFLRLVQALPQSLQLRICVVTQDLHSVGSTVPAIEPFGALVAGSAQVAAKENPDWRVSCVDLSSQDDPAIDLIARETGADIAIRRGARFERVLHPVELPPADPSSLPLRKSGVYLIVGGAGGLGLVVGRHLGEQVQGRLILVGRSELSARQKASIADLETRGCQVLYCRADASDEPSMREVVRKAHERFGPINGVIHSALTLRDQSMARMQPEAFNAVLASKLEGSLVLEAVTRDEPLDFLVFFSSANSVLANAGQSNYVAGCAFQDAFAERLRRQGRPAQTINWGLWGEVGIMAGTDQEAHLEQLGIHPIRVGEGRDAWARILASGLGQVIPVRMLPTVFESCGIHLADGLRLLAAERDSVSDLVARALGSAGEKERAAAEACVAGMQLLEDLCAGRLFATLGAMGALPARAGAAVDERFPGDWSPRHRDLWPTLLGVLVRAGLLERSGSELRVTELRAAPPASVRPESDSGELSAFHELAEVCLESFPDVVRGKLLATDVLFPDASMERLERIYSGNAPLDLFNHLAGESVAAFLRSRWLAGQAHKPVRILEIGAGTGGTSRFILDAIDRAVSEAGPGAHPVEFLYTDISMAFADFGQQKFGSRFPFATFQVLNIESEPAGQGIDLNSLDLVVAANVLHATRSIGATLTHAKRLLRRNGLLVLNELTQASNFTTVTFGLLDGWWLSSDPELRIPGSPLLSVDGWREALGSCGFRRISVFGGSTGRQSLIVAESDGLVRAPEAAAAPVQHAQEADPAPFHSGALHSAGQLEEAVRQQVALTLRLSPGEVDGDRRFSEYGVDSILAVELVKRINRVLGTKLKTTVLFDHSSVNEMAGHLRTIVKEVPRSPAVPAGGPQASGAFRGLVIRGPGEVGDLRLEPVAVAEPKAGEIQIAVRAFGLNFGDWLCVRGLYPFMPDYPFVAGLEVSGHVVGVGPGVTRFRAGDAVIALTGARFGGYAERVTVDHRLAVAKPAGASFEDAAAYPVAFMTAYEALEAARLRAGDRILIQTAAGGTGLMAVQLALERGAEIYATAGSPEKLEYLRRIGVREVIDYREQDFALEVRRRTGGYGVDVVLNMLSGDAIQKGLDLLAPGGRYIEIALGGLKSAKGIDLSRLNEGQSIHTINLLHRLKNRPDQVPADLEIMARHLAGGRVKPTLSRVFGFEDVAQAYRHLESRQNIGKVVVSVPVAADVPDAGAPRAQPEFGGNEIAIIGMSGRFPGADDLDHFWSNLAAGRSSIEEVPAGRWPIEGFYDANPGAPDRSISKWGGFLSRIECFDPLFFNLSGREAERMDPQQRLFLEEAWHALEDAGYPGRSMSGSRCGLFVGVGAGDYDQKLKSAGLPADGYVFTGNQSSILAARLSYFLNLKGPALAVDTACSSSLVAVHVACQALRQGEIDTALVGGVFINTTPAFHVLCSKAGMLSPSGLCRTFDQSADGFVPGEGVGAVVLKPLGRALADGDRIHAVIKGSGINQDGKTNGITAPSAESQSALEREVYERSGVDPSSLSYVETHGTGTKLGDPIEVEGLTKAFRTYTRDSGFCALGSVKTNIGHAATAAGIASLLKVALSLVRGKLPPSLNFETENEHLLLRETPFFVNGALRDWTAGAGKPRRAAVSSFGFSGTNCHVVLEEAPSAPRIAGGVVPPAWLFTISARTEAALVQRRRDLVAWLASNPRCDLSAVSQTLSAGRDHFEHRFAAVAADSAELAAALNAQDDAGLSPTGASGGVDSVERALDALRRPLQPDRYRAVLETLGRHYRDGANVDWARLYGGSARRRVSLPGYPFARDRFWVPEAQPAVPAAAKGGDSILHLTGKESYLRDHVISGRRIVPAVVFMEWAGTAATSVGWGPPVRLEHLAWTSPLSIPETGGDVVVAISASSARARIEVRSPGRTHFSAEAVRGQGAAAPRRIDVGEIGRRCGSPVEPDALYELFSSLGVDYGATFETVRKISCGEGEALTAVELAQSDGTAGSHALPPGLMDGALQALMLLVQRNGRLGQRPFVPVNLASLTVHGPLPRRLFAHATLVAANAEGLRFDIDVATPEGDVLLELRGLGLREWREKGKPQAAPEASPAPQGFLPGQAEAEAVLAGFMAAELKIPVASIRPADPFENLGIDSVMVDHLNFVLEKRLGPISRTLFFEYQNLRDLTGYFLRKHAAQLRAWMDSEAGSPAEPENTAGQRNGSNGSGANGGHASGKPDKALLAAPGVRRNGDAPAADRDIAIVGIAGRFPRARDMAEFWENLRSGRDCITEVPHDRWDAEKWYDADPSKEGKIYAKWGGFIDDVDRFDPLFFRISPQEAELMDPQERQFLEIAYLALEDAGYTPEGLRDASPGPRGLNVGVFVGVMWGDYQLYGAPSENPAGPLPRSAYWSIANRVSYNFDFQGPSLAIDTACSASLTAIHLACESLQRGHCKAALAGGVNLSLHPNKYLQLCQLGFGSTDGRCRSFGAGGDGYVPGEGVGAILLKTLDDAERDGDEIRAVIKATGCNHGGKTNGYSVPNPNAQAHLIADVMERSGVDPRSISFVEAHGTGTALGDPIEITGLTRAFEEFTDERQFCSIGSAKSNIGHLEAAAGVAAVAKVLLQMRHRQLAPSLHSATINPNIRFEQTPFRLQRELAAWRRPEIGGVEQPLRAAISSFGAGGSNTNLILEEYTRPAPASGGGDSPEVIVLSAANPGRLRKRASQLMAFLGSSAEWRLADVAHTLQVGRRPMAYRLAFVVAGREELVGGLAAFLNGDGARVHVGRVDDGATVTGGARPAAPGTQHAGADVLEDAARAWVLGEALEWRLLRAQKAMPRRVSLPTYPFDGERYWVPGVASGDPDGRAADGEPEVDIGLLGEKELDARLLDLLGEADEAALESVVHWLPVSRPPPTPSRHVRNGEHSGVAMGVDRAVQAEAPALRRGEDERIGRAEPLLEVLSPGRVSGAAQDEVVAAIEGAIGRLLKLRLGAADRKKPFTDFGLDSIGAVKLANELKTKLGVAVTPALFAAHPTIDALARTLAAEKRQGGAS